MIFFQNSSSIIITPMCIPAICGVAHLATSAVHRVGIWLGPGSVHAALVRLRSAPIQRGFLLRSSQAHFISSAVHRGARIWLASAAIHAARVRLTPRAINTAQNRLSSSAIDGTHIWLSPRAINRGSLGVLSPAAVHGALAQLPAVRRCLSSGRRWWSLCWPALAGRCASPGNSILAIHPTGRTGLAALPLQSIHFCICAA